MRLRTIWVWLTLLFLMALVASGGAEAPEAAGGWLSLRVLGVAVDDEGVVRLVPVARQYAVCTERGETVGLLSSGGTLPLPADEEGTLYTVKAVDTPADGFSVDTTTHNAVLFPGRETVCQPIVQSEMGFFSFAHRAEADGAAVSGGAFALYDEFNAQVLTFSAGADGLYTPAKPMPAGRYTLRMERAAEGYQYTDAEAEVVIAQSFAQKDAAGPVVLQSEPVPASLHTPDVTAEARALPSLFSQDAEIDITVSLFDGDPPLALYDVSYTFLLPEVAGLRVEDQRPDGLSVSIPRRFALEAVEELLALTVTGTVCYSFAYRVTAHEEAVVQVEAPFSVTVATFAPMPERPAYALYGAVTDGDGAPAVGVSASLVGTDGGVISETVTDPMGMYAFERAPDGASVRIGTPEGYGALWSGTDARILPLLTVRGMVILHGDWEGKPVQLLYGPLGPIAPDADGGFAFTGVFTGEESLSVGAPDGSLWTVEEADGGLTVNLYTPASMRGTVAGPDGTPVRCALVTAVRAESAGGAEWTAETGEDGAWHIDGLFPGAYSVAFRAPDGYVASGAEALPISLEAGQTAAVEGVGMMPPVAIEGQIVDDGEPVAGVAVTLQPGGRRAVTNVYGYFSFERLYAGVYTVEPELPEDMLLLSAPGDISPGAAGERASVQMEVARPARLSGRVWYDENDDGLITADESGLFDIAVALLDGVTMETVARVRTDKEGLFRFDGLMPGTYRVAVELPEAMIFAREAPSAQRLIAGVNGQSAVSEPIALASGDVRDGLSCGAIDAGSVYGRIGQDGAVGARGDGAQAPVSGITVELWRDGAPFASAVTDVDGAYQFVSLRPGEYMVRMQLQDGLVWASSDGVPSGTFMQAVSVRRWRPNVEVNAVVQQIGSLSVRVWLDADADGHDWNETGYAGIALSLIRVQNGGRRVANAVTDADGRATFDGLMPDTYRVDYVVPTGWGFSAGVEGTASGFAHGIPIAIAGGDSAETSAGITALGRIEGIVFGDADYDGLRGDAEDGLSVTVSLIDPASGTVLRQTAADAKGNYRLDGLMAGRYVVRFALQDGYRFTKNRPDAPSFNSNVQETMDAVSETATLYLPMGETLRVDAGGYKPASVSGTLWHDESNTGRRTVQSAPLAGVAVSLQTDEETLTVTVTDENGAFTFEGISPGQYAIGVTLPDAMRFCLIADAGDSMIQGVAGTVGTTDPFVLRMGDAKADISIGAVYVGAVAGRVMDALTGLGIPGAEIQILRSEVLLQQAITGADGQFRADGMRPGDAQVELVLPEGYTYGDYADGAMSVTVAQGGEAWCEMALPPEAAVEGQLRLRDIGDGVESPLVGAKVLLRAGGGGGGTIGEAQSDAYGRFRFDGLSAGEYGLSVQPPSGIYLYDDSAAASFSVQIGETREYAAFAYIASLISGMVWEDLNNNGVQDDGEPAMPDVIVTLLNAGGEVVAEVETNRQGRYSIDQLPPMNCSLRIALPEGYRIVTEQALEPIRLQMGARLQDKNIGIVRTARVGDLVWLDLNGNGLLDTAEPGVEGIAVALLRVLPGGALEPVGETVTDALGHYRFDNVLPGVFRVVFTLGEAYLPTQRFVGLEQINSKILWPEDGEAPTTEPFDLLSGSALLNIDAGLVTREIAALLGWIEGEAPAAATKAPAAATKAPAATEAPAGASAATGGGQGYGEEAIESDLADDWDAPAEMDGPEDLEDLADNSQTAIAATMTQPMPVTTAGPSSAAKRASALEPTQRAIVY